MPVHEAFDERGTQPRRGSRARRLRLAGVVLVLSSLGGAARAQQVTITIGGYGAPPSGAAQPAAPQPAASGMASGLQGPAAWAQIAAYGRYMQYLSVLNYQSTHGGALPAPAETKDYFTNGATVTSVPSAGPGAAYFTNGSEATALPSASPPPSAAAAPPPPQPPGQSPWVVVYQNPSPPPAAPAPAVAQPPPPPEPVAEVHAPPTAMSFEDWLESMGLDRAPPASESKPTLTSAEVEAVPLAEPSAAANDVRERVAYKVPEKPRARAAVGSSGGGGALGITAAFSAGLILGGLAMLRLRDRRRVDAESTPAATK